MRMVPLDAGLLDQVVALEKSVFTARDPWPRPAFESELRNPAALWLAALEGEGLVAYAGGWCVPPEFHLLNLGVHPEFRRKGLASALLGELFLAASLRGCGEVYLEVRQGNEGAKIMYEKLGFAVVSTRAHYYPSGEDALVYRRPATGSSSEARLR